MIADESSWLFIRFAEFYEIVLFKISFFTRRSAKSSVTDMVEANAYLKQTFIPAYNLQFSVIPQNMEKAYRKNIFGNLDLIFCKKLPRKIGSGNTFSWQGETWILQEKHNYANRIININTHLNGSYSFDIMGRKVQAQFKASERRYDWDKKKKLG